MEKNELRFDVLSNQDNAVARRFGLVFEFPELVHGFYQSERINLPGTQGNENFERPMTETYIIRSDGVVAHAHVDLDLTKRRDPHEVVVILEALTKI